MNTRPLCVRINIDGGSRGNPGPAAAGVVIRDTEDNVTLYEGGIFIGKSTNNVAEYHGLIAGLQAAARLRADQVEILSDSELLVKQMNGEYRVKNANLKVLFDRANGLLAGFSKCKFRHVRREQNTQADRLVNRAINLGRNVEDAEN